MTADDRSIDELDRRVLETLRDHPRATLSEQANITGVSRATFRARLDRLWDTGIISGLEPALDLASLGFQLQAIVELRVDMGRIDDVERMLQDCPAVIEAFITTGESDIVSRVAAPTPEELQRLLESFARHDAVRTTSSNVILRSVVSHRKVQALEALPLAASPRVAN